METATVQATADYQVADLSLAGFGRQEINIAETEMPELKPLNQQ